MDVEVDGIMVAAHELKAPLIVMRQLALSFDEMGNSNERIRSELVKVSDRAIKQVNDLIKVRRLEDGLFEMEPVSVRAVCDEVTKELEQLFNGNNRGISVKYFNRSKLAVANKELLFSVVYNFLLNAFHYSNEETRAELVVRDVRDRIRVIVRDFGPALPIGVWRELKTGFVDKPISVSMRPGSSGLGLYIASKFSKYMNASVGAIRHRDGASFYVELPVSKQASFLYDFYN